MRGLSKLQASFCVVILAVLNACWTSETTNPSLAVVGSQEKIVTSDDHLAEIVAKEPEFGGMFWGNDGRLKVWVVGQAAMGSSLKEAIGDFLAKGAKAGRTSRVKHHR